MSKNEIASQGLKALSNQDFIKLLVQFGEQWKNGKFAKIIKTLGNKYFEKHPKEM